MHSVPEKLVALLGSPPSHKKEILQAFSELRKLLEQQGERQRLSSLNLFCDWVVRGKLDPEPAREFLLRLDDGLGRYDPDNLDDLSSADDALENVSFSVLRDELEEFCERLGLPVIWTYEDAAWDGVVALLAEAVGNSPLKLSRKSCNFTRLREVVLSVSKPEESTVGAQAGPVYGLKWEGTLDDGRPFNLAYVEYPADDSEDDSDDTV